MRFSTKFMTDLNELMVESYWRQYFSEELLQFFANTYGSTEISYAEMLNAVQTHPDVPEDQREFWINTIVMLQTNPIAIKYGNRYERLEEYISLGINYSENFTDLTSAKTAIAQKQDEYYSTEIGGNYFSFSQVTDVPSGYLVAPLQSLDALEPNANVQVYSIKGKSTVVTPDQLTSYLEQEVTLGKQEDANFWKVQQKLRDTDDGFTVFETIA